MDAFTWFMLLLVGCLEATTSHSCCTTVVRGFLMELLGENPGVEYLERELPVHIQGWSSAACVRNITHKAQSIWGRLGGEGRHLPGLIPDNEAKELIRLFKWVAAGPHESRQYLTSSTDAVCVAAILEEIGLDLLTTNTALELLDEPRITVRLDVSFVPTDPERQMLISRGRRGMRIPLGYMPEAVSIWPGNKDGNNNRRLLFENGMWAAREIRLKPRHGNYCLDTEDFDGAFTMGPPEALAQEHERVDSDVFRLANTFLLALTRRAVGYLGDLIRGWDGDVTGCIHDLEELSPRNEHLNRLAQLQTFMMGYYYQLLLQLVDTSQLSSPEAFGSWGWYDTEFLGLAKEICQSRKSSPAELLHKYEVMKLIGYLFAGVTFQQTREFRWRPPIVGVIGKLCLVYSSLMGDNDTPAKAGRFWLLDIDTTWIPSLPSGLIIAGRSPNKTTRMVEESVPSAAVDVATSTTASLKDFTSHIEPDWDNDVQQCLVAFRHEGRLVQRLSPLRCDTAITRLWQLSSRDVDWLPEDEAAITRQCLASTWSYYAARLDEFHGGFVIDPPADPQSRLLLRLSGLPKAQSCIIGMYFDGQIKAKITADQFPTFPSLSGDGFLKTSRTFII